MKHLILILSVFVLATGCAKNRGVEKERLDETKDRLEKTAVTGTGAERDIYYSKITVVKNSTDGGFVFAGLQSDMNVGFFTFTETKLQFKSMQGPYVGRETTANSAPVIFQWPVTHHQPQLDTVDGKTTNKEFDDNRLKWDQKNFFVADFSTPDISEQTTLTGTSECWVEKSRRKVDNSVVTEPGYLSFLVEVVYERSCPTSMETIYNGFSTYTVQYRYSFRKRETTDYKPFFFQGELDPKMQKFGYFQSVKEEIDPADGRPKNLFFVNRWNPTKKHHFWFTQNTSEEFKPLIYDIFKKTNAVLSKAAPGMEMILHENNEGEDGKVDGKTRELGDLRYAYVNIVDTIDPSAPLGYGPSDADPFTGEIISASLNIWSSSLKDYIRRIKKSSARMPTKWQDSNLYVKMQETLGTDPSQWSTHWDVTDPKAEFLQHMTQFTTYGYPGWNSFAKSQGALPVEVYLDKPLSVQKDGRNYVAVRTDIQNDWVDYSTKIVNFKEFSNSAFIQPKIIDFKPIEDSPLFQVLSRNRPNSASGLPSMSAFKEFTHQMDKYQKSTLENVSRNMRGHCAMNMEDAVGGLNPDIIDGFSPEEIAANIIYRTAIHEFGHNLNLRHNFYGSVDKANFPKQTVPMKEKNEQGVLVSKLDENGKPVMWPTISSSVMDYLRLQDDYFNEPQWDPYDVAAIQYAYSGGKVDEGKLYLFCTDEHTVSNAMCNQFDRGTTPSEVALSIIDAYEDGYYTRNYRDGRAYWNTSAYFAGIIKTMQNIKEFLPMWRAAFYESSMRDQLKIKGYGKDASNQMIEEVNREMKKAIKLSVAFYQSVLQQSDSDKPFRSEYHAQGALQRMGIGNDKLAAMFFMGGDDALFYNPNRVLLSNSYMTYMYEPDLAVMMEKVLENIVTQRVDMEPWFIGYGRQLYAQSAMNYNNRDDQNMISKIKIKKYSADDLLKYFGYDLKSVTNSKKTANLVTLTESADADFKRGDEVAVIRSNANYYVFSRKQNIFATDVYKNIKSAEEAGTSVTEGQLDLQELYYIYSYFTTGTI